MTQQTHHQWCIYFSEVIKGSCSECERLRLLYPATGDLDYPVIFEDKESL